MIVASRSTGKAGRRFVLIASILLALPTLALAAVVVPALVGSGDYGVETRKALAISLRDPADEAHQAARRGDFRFAFTFPGDMSLIGPGHPGIDCLLWIRDATAFFDVNGGTRYGDGFYHRALLRFLTRYNRALVEDPAFPYPEFCARDDQKPASRFTGPIHGFADAARAGDIAAVRRLAASDRRDIDRRDFLGYTALQWALRDHFREVALTLLALGADPNLRSPDWAGDRARGPAPLARVLQSGDMRLIAALLAHGARMSGRTGLCERGDMPPSDAICSWAGLVARSKRIDLLPAALDVDLPPPDPDNPTLDDLPPFFSGRVELFDLLLSTHDLDLANRLVPFVKTDDPGATVAGLLRNGRRALAHSYALANRGRLGFSAAESSVWEAAAERGQDDAIELLADLGGELNLLPRSQIDGCRSFARGGRTHLLLGCIKAAARRASAIEAALRSHRIAVVRRLLAEAADLHVARRAGIPDLIARYGSADLARAVASQLAPPLWDHPRRASISSFRQEYKGPLAETVRHWPGYAALATRLAAMSSPVAIAVDRGDAALLAAVANAFPAYVPAALEMTLGKAIPGTISGLSFNEVDQSHFADAPPEPSRRIALNLIAAIGRHGDPQTLEPALRTSIGQGWDELIRAMLKAGFDPRRAPSRFGLWESWTEFDSICRPSTGRLLIDAGLSTDLGVEPAIHEDSLLHEVVKTCRNPRSVRVIAAAAPAQLHDMQRDGATLVDEARRRRRTKAEAVLRAFGVVSARELTGAEAARAAALRRYNQWDLVPLLSDD